ncbi:ribbon-helix-helix protein, CopG family [Desulfurococcaceae archaeon MEX13E-LK6-19]|nr:ribbon-helix-helix protein, CopG family [Desulfurococcaceae archaeon MEX13E-LK6-19]
MRVISFKADEDFLEQVDKLARRMNLSRSELIRVAIESFIKINGNNINISSLTKKLKEI